MIDDNDNNFHYNDNYNYIYNYGYDYNYYMSIYQHTRRQGRERATQGMLGQQLCK